MKKIIFTLAIFTLFIGCKKEPIEPNNTIAPGDTISVIVNDSVIIDTIVPIPSELLFSSNSDDSIYITSNQVDENGYLYSSDGFIVRVEVHTPDSIKVGSYMNEYLISNVNYGLDLIHGIVLGDGSKGAVRLGESATQINTLEVTQVRNDSVWIVYDVDWTYTHWLHTYKNKSGNIKAELNGFKFR